MNDFLFIHDYPPFGGGGIETNTFALAKAISQRGYSVGILTSRETSETVLTPIRSRRSDSVQIFIRDSDPEIARVIDTYLYPVILGTFSLRTAMMASLKALYQKGRLYGFYLQTNLSHCEFSALSELPGSQKSQRLSEFQKCLADPNCNLLAVSKAGVESFRALNIEKDISVVSPGIDWSNIPQAEAEIYDVCFIGELAANKGIHMLPYATTLLKESFPKLKVLIIGEGNSRKDLGVEFRLLGHKDIEFAGLLDHDTTLKFLARSKVLVQPSFSESWGNVVVEGLGLAREVVVSKSEGLRESSALSPISLTFEPGNIIEMTRAIKYALQRFDDRRLMRHYSAPRVRALASIENQVEKLLKCSGQAREKAQSNWRWV